MRKFVAFVLISGIGDATLAQEPKPVPIVRPEGSNLGFMGGSTLFRTRPASEARADLNAMQGDWRLKSSDGLGGREAEARELGLGRDGTRLRIERNRVTINSSREPLVLANHLPPTYQVRAVEGEALVCFTKPDGQGVLASYKLSGDALEVRYPEFSCPRTGVLLHFERVKK